MKKLNRIFGFLAVAAAMLAAPVAAQADQAVALTGDVKIVKNITDENGETKTEFAEPDVVVPGDRLVFRTNYKNQSAEPVNNFVVTNPLPAAVVLAAESAAELSISVDGGTTFGLLADLTVTAEDGQVRPATVSDATHVRWVLDVIQPGAEGQIIFYAFVR